MKKIYFVSFLFLAAVTLQSGINFSSQPPTDLTGAVGDYCTNCHGGNARNAAGGSVTLNGLPVGGYVPNQTYPLSLTITHGSANRTRWGFSIAAVNAGGAPLGTFNTTNPNAAINGSELSHNSAVSTSAQSSYTYNNLSWRAPATASGTVNFYFVGNAANGSGSGGDFIYSGTSNVALPINLKSINAAQQNGVVTINWQTINELNAQYFEVERSDDGQFFYSLEKVATKGTSNKGADYSFKDLKATNGTTIFYRLKMIDNNGSARYSSTVTVKPFVSGFTIKNVYPTIIRSGEGFNVEVESEKNRTLTLSLLDITGKKIQSQNFNVYKGSNQLKVNNTNLANTNGIVLLQIAGDNFLQTKTLICKY
jgi:hypothetical protein